MEVSSPKVWGTPTAPYDYYKDRIIVAIIGVDKGMKVAKGFSDGLCNRDLQGTLRYRFFHKERKKLWKLFLDSEL
jgi:hypothetical protein